MKPVRVPRLRDHAARFNALIEERWATPFRWAEHDCALWAADAILAQTGVDPAADIRAHYKGKSSADRMVRRLGGLQKIATDALGAPLAAPMLAGVGDIGLTPAGALAVCIGEWWTAPSKEGLVLVPLGEAKMAWRVG